MSRCKRLPHISLKCIGFCSFCQQDQFVNYMAGLNTLKKCFFQTSVDLFRNLTTCCGEIEELIILCSRIYTNMWSRSVPGSMCGQLTAICNAATQQQLSHHNDIMRPEAVTVAGLGHCQHLGCCSKPEHTCNISGPVTSLCDHRLRSNTTKNSCPKM